MDQFIYIASLAAVFLLAGTIKGIVGLGLPTTALGLMTLFIDPRTAIAVLIFPLVFSNAWQMYRAGDIRASIKRYLPFVVALVIFVWLSVQLSVAVDHNILLAAMGISILLFVIVNAIDITPPVPERFDKIAQLIAGVFAGIMGGLTSVWAPPMAIYLAARQVPKAEFIRASGLIFFIGSIPLAFGYVRAGFLTYELAQTSVIVLVPTFAGFWVGERVRAHMSEQVFRNALLAIFLVMGLNLLRRAMFG
jgi:uncharacterized membrane protein YfcA